MQLKTSSVMSSIFHMPRHTHTSMLILNGVTPKDVQKRSGLTNISITLNTYTHTTEESQRELFAKL
ncbi:tyrosine-type recombinase/integrase [Metaclostridioides mangenotii]|uniref:tyrosine-type recombinase/integrase n=1 Tax=Metaclostridioides mangenotii TaxID=1540 RepID=UPI0026EAE227|nr:tyrosine-type recombinase/integrase [Clostridioides mangenotii]